MKFLHSPARGTFSLVFAMALATTVAAATQAFIPPKYQEIVRYAPVSEYPGGVRYAGGYKADEYGIYRLKIDPKTGAVREVSVMHRASQSKLNATVVLDLMKWKFQPGSISSIDVPVQFDRDLIRPELKNAVVRN